MVELINRKMLAYDNSLLLLEVRKKLFLFFNKYRDIIHNNKSNTVTGLFLN